MTKFKLNIFSHIIIYFKMTCCNSFYVCVCSLHCAVRQTDVFLLGPSFLYKHVMRA